jgi:hypothetical protein
MAKSSSKSALPDKSQEPRRIKFDDSDFDVLATVLDTQPELKICALALKESRKLEVKYPLKNLDVITKLLGSKKTLVVEGHRISAATIEKYLIKEDFPIEDENQLIARVHIALWRCKEDIRLSLQAPKDYASILKTLNA